MQKQKTKKRLGNTRYVFENYSQWVQQYNELKYEIIQTSKRIRELDNALGTLINCIPKVKIEPV